MVFELHHLTAHEQWDGLHRGDLAASALVEHSLARIEALNPELGAFSRVDAERARAAAAAFDAAGPDPAPLAGVVVAEKELQRRAGTRGAGAARLLADVVHEESDALTRAIDTSGAISVGATTSPEFGLVGFTEPLGRPPAVNPWDPTTGAGGSSGGAAVAVATGMVPAAIGSDGGGSIRIPAAWCGVVGLKPSRGRVPSLGGQAMPPGMVTAGPLARTVADAAMLLDALVSPDGLPPAHPYALVAPGEGPFLTAAIRGEGRFNIAVLSGSPWDGALDVRVDASIAAAVDRTADALAAIGHGLEPLAMPAEDYPDFFRILWQANTAGIPAHGDAELGLLEPYTRELVERGRAMTAETVLGALAAAAEFERRTIALFAAFDAVLLPTVAMRPRPLGWYWEAPTADEVFDRQVLAAPFTSFVNVSGLPAISLPVGASDEGWPEAVQLIGRPGGEATLLSIGRQLERRFRWERRHPARFW